MRLFRWLKRRPHENALRDYDPVECECEEPDPTTLGECRHCRRLIITHSWHNGVPE